MWMYGIPSCVMLAACIGQFVKPQMSTEPCRDKHENRLGNPPLQEFHRVIGWSATNSPIEKKYQEMKLMPPYEYFYRKATENLEEILKPRPVVKPIVRRQRLQLPPEVPKDGVSPPGPSIASVSETVEKVISPVAVSETVEEVISTVADTVGRVENVIEPVSETVVEPANPPIVNLLGKKPTARKSTRGKITKVRSKKQTKLCKVTCIDLQRSALATLVKPLVREFRKSKRCGGSRKKDKIIERKDSTDSGLATDEDDFMTVPTHEDNQPMVHQQRSKTETTTKVKSGKRAAPPSAPKTVKKNRRLIRPKEVTDSNSQKEDGGSRKHLMGRTLSLPVSIPLDVGNGYIQNFIKNHNNNRNNNNHHKTSSVKIPRDVVATSEFDIGKLMVSELATKRYRDRIPPLQIFSPYDTEEKLVCVNCNLPFKTKQELANHELANHHAFNY